ARSDLQAAPAQAILRSGLQLCRVPRGPSENIAGTGLARPLLARRILPSLRPLRCARLVPPRARHCGPGVARSWLGRGRARWRIRLGGVVWVFFLLFAAAICARRLPDFCGFGACSRADPAAIPLL